MLSPISSVSFKGDPKSPGCYWVDCLGGYHPPLSTEMGWFLTRMTSTKEDGSITSIQVVYVPAGDLTGPAAPASHPICVDAATVLSRGLAAKGIYPASSRSWRFKVNYATTSDHWWRTLWNCLRKELNKQTLQRYKELLAIKAILSLAELSEEEA